MQITKMKCRKLAVAVLLLASGCAVREAEREAGPKAASTEAYETVKVMKVDPAAKPIRDIRKSSCCPIMGYAGSMLGEPDAKYWYEQNREGLAKAFRACGARFVRQWDAIRFWQTGAGARLVGKVGDAKDPRRIANPENVTDMKNVFSFYKEYGVKVTLTLENYFVITNKETWATSSRREDVQRVICDYVRWIVDNGFKDVVGAFELGNEPYWNGTSLFKGDPKTNPNSPENYAAKWTPIVLAIQEIWPKAPIGMTIAEYMTNDPDIEAVRNRMLANQEIKANGYFSEDSLQQWSGRYVVAMSNALPHISHVIQHAYGAETPYSASYHGLTRFRHFNRVFPELKDKKFWITEWRDRSDEDNHAHQRFYNTLTKAGYMLMMVSQPDVDGLNLHEFSSISGALYHSCTRPKDKKTGAFPGGNYDGNWGAGPWIGRPNYDDVGKPELEPGLMGPAMRLMVEALRECPIVLDFGSERHGAFSEGKTNAVYACTEYYDGIFHNYSKAYAQGKTGKDLPRLGDDCQYLVTTDPNGSYLYVLAVNYKPEETKFVLELPKFWKAEVGDYRVYACPTEFVTAHEIPGEPRFTRRWAYQPLRPRPYGPYVLKFPANSVTTVRVPIRRQSLAAAAEDIIKEALTRDKQGAVQFCAYRDGKCIVDVCGGHLTTNKEAPRVRCDSLFPIFSTEKPLLSTAVHRAVELGKMDYDKPLHTWWPEFKGGKKDALTLRMTLAYRSGLNGGIPKAFKRYEEVGNWKNLCDAFAREDCEIEPGTKQRYMPDSYGWALGHPLEVAMGKPFTEVMDELVLAPCGITNEFFYVQGEREFPRIATLYGDDYTVCMNQEWARRALEPASFAVSSARALCKFYNRLCGFDGQPPLLRKETLDMALEPSRHASDPLPSEEVLRDEKRFTMIFGTGYGLWGPCDRLGRIFGHGGCGGSEALCDRDKKLVVAFTCNFEDPYTYRKLRKELYELVEMRWRYWREPADIQTMQMKTAE